MVSLIEKKALTKPLGIICWKKCCAVWFCGWKKYRETTHQWCIVQKAAARYLWGVPHDYPFPICFWKMIFRCLSLFSSTSLNNGLIFKILTLSSKGTQLSPVGWHRCSNLCNAKTHLRVKPLLGTNLFWNHVVAQTENYTTEKPTNWIELIWVWVEKETCFLYVVYNDLECVGLGERFLDGTVVE